MPLGLKVDNCVCVYEHSGSVNGDSICNMFANVERSCSTASNASTLQRFNVSTFQRFNVSTFQRFNVDEIFNISTFQRFNISLTTEYLQHFNVSTFQQFQRFNIFNIEEPRSETYQGMKVWFGMRRLRSERSLGPGRAAFLRSSGCGLG